VAEVKPTRPEDPTTIAGYRIRGRLGEGGQGTAFLGQGAGGEQVAVKLLHSHLIDDPQARERFVREVQLATSVARFCTAQILSTGLHGDRPYIVSEYVPGVSLDQSVRQDGPRTGAALERLAINTATALAAIHSAGVLHRDFKPGNILLGPDGPVVIDFGIARALDLGLGQTSRHSQVVGTPSYMAPEQLNESGVGPAADVFAWALTMVYAANGRPAFAASTLPSLFRAVLESEPDLGAVHSPLRELVAACLAKDPALRPTAEQLVRQLSGTAAAPAGGFCFPAPAAPVTEVPPAPVTAPAFGLAAPPPEHLAPVGGPHTAPLRKNRPGWLIPLAAAAAVIVLAGVPAAFFLTRSSSNTPDGQAAIGRSPQPGGMSPGTVGAVGSSPSPGRATGSPSPGPTPGKTGKKGKKKASANSSAGPTAGLLGPNLVVDGGFENGLTGWTKSRGDTTAVTSPRYDGAHVVRINVAQGTGMDATAEQVVTGLKPKTDYVLAGWVKSDGGVTYLGVKLYDGSKSASHTTTLTSWVKLTTYFSTGATNTTAQIWCYRPPVSAGYTVGTSYCDDISVRKYGA